MQNFTVELPIRMDQPYQLVVAVVSVIPDPEGETVQVQEILLREGSSDAGTHVAKNFAVVDAVTGAVTDAMKSLAGESGLGPKAKGKA